MTKSFMLILYCIYKRCTRQTIVSCLSYKTFATFGVNDVLGRTCDFLTPSYPFGGHSFPNKEVAEIIVVQISTLDITWSLRGCVLAISRQHIKRY